MRTTTSLDIQPKAHKWNGAIVQSKNTQGCYNAEIHAKGDFIRIFGVMTNHIHGAQQFDLTFNVGDSAVYDSYNLTYVGRVVHIGPKTVTIKQREQSEKCTRLDLCTFIDRNWDFNATRIAEENARTMQYI